MYKGSLAEHTVQDMSTHTSPLHMAGQLPPYTLNSNHSTPGHGTPNGPSTYADPASFELKADSRDLQPLTIPPHLTLPMLSMPAPVPTQVPAQIQHVQPLQQSQHTLQQSQSQVPHVPLQQVQPVQVQQSQPAEASSSKAKNGHTGPAEGKAKPHLCTACNRAFTTGGHLQRHQRIHTGVKAFKCPFPGCETRTSRQDNLQQQ
jgi:uncharacterized Zn-finger protein